MRIKISFPPNLRVLSLTVTETLVTKMVMSIVMTTKRGANCKFFHPNLCHDSVDFFQCDKVYCNYYHLVGTPRPNFGNSTRNNDQISVSQHQNNSDGDNDNHVEVQKSTAYTWLDCCCSTQHKLYSLLLPPAMGARFYRFLGRPAKWTRWLAGAAAIKSG